MAIAKKKKRFFEVEIPCVNKTTFIQAFEIEEADGRLLNYDLTRMLRGKNTLMSARIEVHDKHATAIPRALKILPSFMKRAVRKGTNYVEDSFTTETKDAKVIVKPFLITRRKVPRSVRKALREQTGEYLISTLKEKTSEEFIEDLIRGSLQKTLSLKLKKTYPLSLCEVRIFRVEKYLENAPKETLTTSKKSEEEDNSDRAGRRGSEAPVGGAEPIEETKEEKPKKVTKKKTASKKEREEKEQTF